ncbi:MAG: hypothetical protein COB15_05865 [Flavobacteriales bacterium]|nr:MAG: hypothetical protein COB15_05865 [Flavobacteriales bacterium]
MLKKIIIKIAEILLLPLTVVSAIWMKFLANAGMHRATISEKIFMAVGVMPIRDHYYEPLINPKKHLKKSLREDRNLPGLDLNINAQLDLLSKFKFNEELENLPLNESDKTAELQFYYNNGSYISGDAEYLYNIVRHFQPKNIIEIGSGYSTLMVLEAVRNIKKEDSKYNLSHTCIEPYEQPWLEKTGASIIRKKVEDMELSFFSSLGNNDILFIDSSHMVRPQGDVLYEFLEILPTLNSGVIVHIHDIFTPKDYLDEWVFEDHKHWNEQYVLEAFLSNNNDFEIIGAVNHLMHNYKEELCKTAPILKNQKDREPGSFWIRKK